MKAIVVRKIGRFNIEEVDVPRPGEGEVLIKVSVTGLCRTDLKIIRAGHRDLLLPRIPGEEVVGTVVAPGRDGAGFNRGQRVYVYPGTSCGQCRECRKGAENLCKHMRIMGFHRDGGFAEYVSAPVKSLIPVADELGDDEAVFAEPLSCCLNALELARIAPDDLVGIWGGGPAGTLLARAASALGARPHIIEKDERRRSLAAGVTTAPVEGCDLAVVAVGAPEAYQEALEHLNPRGRLVVFSGLPPSQGILPVDFNQLHYFEQTLIGAYGCSYRHGEQALRLIQEQKVQVKDMISHRMALDELDAGLELVARRAGMKILLYP